MTTAERIKTARKEAGITQDELASKMYVTHHCISMWERGLRQPKYETLTRIADALGINVNRLLQTPMTNADKIRAMSDEELAEFMFSMVDCVSCENKLMNNGKLIFGTERKTCTDEDYHAMCNGDGRKCKAVCLKWLKQPLKEDA